MALGHSLASHLEVRSKLQELKGNQGQFRRQDVEGIFRAVEINRLNVKRSYYLRRPRQGLPEAANKINKVTVMIDTLRLQHQRKELKREVYAMQAHLEKVKKMAGGALQGELAETSAALAAADGFVCVPV